MSIKIAYFTFINSIAPASIKQTFCLSLILINTENSVLTFPYPVYNLFLRNKRPFPC
jgi:hypothetical protein